MNRLCSCCNKEKETKEFYKKGKYFHSRCKKCLHKIAGQKKLARRIKIVNIMGGKCVKCGYSKNYAALDIHHKNPLEKELNGQDLKEKPWKTVIQEIKKCELLCKNCHAELHNSHLYTDINLSLPQSDISLDAQIEFGTCKICKSETFGSPFCSNKCAGKARRKCRRPQKSTLRKQINTMSWTAIGKEYGVSDNAVRKWAKKYGLI